MSTSHEIPAEWVGPNGTVTLRVVEDFGVAKYTINGKVVPKEEFDRVAKAIGAVS